MARKHNNLLGLALTENTVQLAETRGGGASAKAVKRSVLTIDTAALFDDPARFGRALREHLEAEGYSTKHAAVGLPSRWLLAHAMSAPPAERDALAGMVRLRIEREFAGGGDMRFDYQDAAGTGDQRHLLLVGHPARRLERVRQALEAAGLTPVRIGATALDVIDGDGDSDGLNLVLDPAGLTLLHGDAGRPTAFTGLAADVGVLGQDTDAPSRLADEAARLTLTRMPQASASAQPLRLHDTAGLDEQTRGALAEALGQRFGGCNASIAEPALAVARSAHTSSGINLLDSKLAVRPPRRVPGYARWLVRAAILLLLVGLAVGYFWWNANRELTALQDEYDTLSDPAQRLERVRTDTRTAAGWYDDRPPVLDSLLALTRTFPREGRIWVTTLSIDDEADGVVACRADNERTMWRYVRAMDESPLLHDVALRQQSEAGREGSEIVFEVTFTYRPDAGEQH